MSPISQLWGRGAGSFRNRPGSSSCRGCSQTGAGRFTLGSAAEMEGGSHSWKRAGLLTDMEIV